MNYEMIENNKVYLQGRVLDEPQFSHAVYEENFYSFNIGVSRLSGQDDVVPVTISEKIIKHNNLKIGDEIALRGQFRSFNKLEDGKSRLILSVFCRELCPLNSEPNPNIVELSGYICKEPIYRTTPFNREISDLLLAVNRNYNKSDYIPCIAWGRNARFVGNLPVGTRVDICGRVQSREYNKRTNEYENPVIKIAYEVSVSKVSQISEEETI